MKIDYTLIDQRAQKRQETLRLVEGLLDSPPLSSISTLLHIFQCLSGAAKDLDAEGVSMLPEAARNLLRMSGTYYDDMRLFSKAFDALEQPEEEAK